MKQLKEWLKKHSWTILKVLLVLFPLTLLAWWLDRSGYLFNFWRLLQRWFMYIVELYQQRTIYEIADNAIALGSILATVVIGILAFHINKSIKNQGIISLEEFRPKIGVSKLRNTEIVFRNQGDFEATDVEIYAIKKNPLTGEISKPYLFFKTNILPAAEETDSQILEDGIYYVFFILFKNLATRKFYFRVFACYCSVYYPILGTKDGLISPLQENEYLALVKESSLDYQIKTVISGDILQKRIRKKILHLTLK